MATVQTTWFRGDDGRRQESRRTNEWIAFGIVAAICGLLAALAGFSGDDEPPRGENDL